MNSSLVRSILTTLGVAAIVIGGVFTGQGAGLIPGSFMTGDPTWLVIGLILVAVGVVLLVLGVRRPRR